MFVLCVCVCVCVKTVSVRVWSRCIVVVLACIVIIDTNTKQVDKELSSSIYFSLASRWGLAHILAFT